MKESPLRISELLLPVGVDLLLASAVKVLIKSIFNLLENQAQRTRKSLFRGKKVL